MTRTMPVIMLAGASTLVHAQWSGEAQTVLPVSRKRAIAGRRR